MGVFGNTYNYSRPLEVLSPAGDMERLEAALEFGADAVYLGGKKFGMRAASPNFTSEQLAEACAKAHALGRRVYLTCNTLPRNDEIPHFEQFVREAQDAKVDALIANDIGVFFMIKRYAPDMEIHMSTQTGIVNYAAANEFYNMGAKRVVLARELSLEEIAEIRAKTPKELEIEVFVHGAMCVSFSGRCLISQYMIDRDANRGECAQPCRWGYHLMEEKRPNEFYPVFEDEAGTYILNAKDLCMIDHIDKLAEAGVDSFKIEGRAKSSYYVSVVTNAYRRAMDEFLKNPDSFTLPKWVHDEVFKVSHRAYCTGFFFGHPKQCQYYESSGYIRDWDVAAIVTGYDKERGLIECVQRNKFLKGDTLELLEPDGMPVTITADEIFDENLEPIESTNHAAMKFFIRSDTEYAKHSIIRIEK
ncbi:putative protease [Ruminococcus sp. YE71]|uniref:peptidase U32 family protein n=1 Tax=unclassified Ruminococcus TaxID=2608920 RepID=UPI0008850A74|nr:MULTISPECIES: U32 family peptidase [unclassified Ruminococcus]SDA21079.1 putative protease [Ruminococcus sp. YE78]SFW33072.1 putative protease [Ruminococcus sp. YE71]